MVLQNYRLRNLAEERIALTPGADATLKPPTDVGTGAGEGPQRERLSKVIEVVNARFGTDFTEADQLFFDQIEEDLVADATLAQQARTNTIENFRFGFEDRFTGRVLDRMDQNAAIFARLMDDAAFAEAVKQVLLGRVYGRLQDAPSPSEGE